MATNADFDALIVRIDTATTTLENNVQTLTEAGSDVAELVTEAQGYATAASASATAAAGSVTAAATQASNAAASASTATTQAGNALTQANRAQQIADDLLNSAPFQEAPEDGQTYGRNNGSWTVVGGGGVGTVQSVNNIAPDEDGNITLAASDVGAKPSSYVPTWTEVTGKPTTFAPIIGTTATTALAGNTVIPTNTNQLTNGANFITAAGAPVQSVAGKTGAVTLAAGDIASGTFATARLGTGTANSSTVLKGDGTWGAPPAASGGFALEVSDFYVNNVLTTNWPTANPNTPIALANCTRKPGGGAVTVTGAQFFTDASNRQYIPDGIYSFASGTFASGHPLAGRIGIIKKVTGGNGPIVEAYSPTFGGTKAVIWSQGLSDATFNIVVTQP